jgi:hypothetical protein
MFLFYLFKTHRSADKGNVIFFRNFLDFFLKKCMSFI